MTRKKPKPRTPVPVMMEAVQPPVVLFDDGLEPYEPVPPPANTDATQAVAPIGRRLDKGFVWEIEPGWTERVERMADAAGLPPEKFLDSILRRAWIALPMSKRGGA